MFCPKCGQQQISDDMRFCSRCGFQLSGVNVLLRQDGMVVGSPVPPPRVNSVKRRRMRQGAKLMFLSAVLIPLAMVLSIVFDSPGPLAVPFLVFVAGLAWLLYNKLFGEETEQGIDARSQGQMADAQQFYLPPPRTTFVNNAESARGRTSEIVQPPSVTESTTRLLDDK